MSDAVEIPYGLTAGGRLLHISHAERGLACGCVCAQCGQPLIAKQGDVLSWHFAHQSDAACHGAVETALHRAAKQVIADARLVRLPEIRAPSGQIDRRAEEIPLEDVRQEPTHLAGVRPDLAARLPDGGELLIEIYVTHAIDADKHAKLTTLRLLSLEIDISSVRPATHEQLVNLVLRAAPRAWAFHPRIVELAIEEGRRVGALKAVALSPKLMWPTNWRPPTGKPPTSVPVVRPFPPNHAHRTALAMLPEFAANLANQDARVCHFCGAHNPPFGCRAPHAPWSETRWFCADHRDDMERLIATGAATHA